MRPPAARSRRAPRAPRAARVAASAALLLGVAACGEPTAAAGARPTARADAGAAAGAPGPGHVHGLGLNPADGAVYVATHHGLLVVGEGGLRPVGESRQDLMGFTVTGPDTFLASGHPAPGRPGPAALGLLRSDDAGLTWRTVSAEGSDFHALTAAGDHVLGLDSTTGILRRSGDSGRTWQDGARLAARAVDVDPAAPDRVLATTEAGLAVSSDGGATFGTHPVQPPELLVHVDHVPAQPAGPSPVTVVGMDLAGRSWTFDGASWTGPGAGVGAGPAAFTVVDADTYLAAVDDGVHRTDDGGGTWERVAALP